MEGKFYFWSLVLMVVLGLWFYSSLQVGIDWDRNPRLVNPINGVRVDPDEILRLSKILDFTEDYVNDTNAEERLYDLILFSNLENVYHVDQSYTRRPEDLNESGWPMANQELCGKQLEWLLSQLGTSHNHTFMKGKLGQQLTNLMDSYGKPEAGLHLGFVHWLGSHKQCTKVNLEPWAISSTRYCLGRMRPKWWPRNETAYPATTISLGLCLPESCDTLSYNRYKSSIQKLMQFGFTKFYRENYNLVSMFCLPDERSPMRKLPTSGYVTIILLGSWSLLVLAASIIYEAYYREKKSVSLTRALARAEEERTKKSNQIQLSNMDQKHDIEHDNSQPISCTDPRQPSFLELFCQSLSLRCSFKAFKTNTFRVKYAAGRRVRLNLGVLDFIKCLMTVVVVLGHCGYLNQLYATSLYLRIETSQLFVSHLAVSISAFVDTFFVIFGILFSYNVLRKFKAHQIGDWRIWLAIVVRIFIRITPLYIVIYWFARAVIPYLDSGPWWDYGVDKQTLKGQCMDEPWWLSIPILASTRRLPWSMCVPTAWFIVSYLQIACILPLVTYIMYGLPRNKHRFIFIGVIALLSSVFIAVQSGSMKTMPVKLFGRFSTLLADMMDKFEVTGFLTAQGRFGSVCIGCLVGYLMLQYELGQLKKWPRWLRKRITMLYAFVFMVFLYSSTYVMSFLHHVYGYETSTEVYITLNILRLIIWPSINSVLFIGLSTTMNHIAVSRFMSHPFWHAFNKLGLAIFLVHYEVIRVLMSSYQYGAPSGMVSDNFKIWPVALFYTIGISLFLHLVVEIPSSNLITYIDKYLDKTSSKDRPSQESEMS